MAEHWRERLDWRASTRHDERMPTKHPLHTHPADPARVDPAHLPALHHIAADLHGCTAPIRIVNTQPLDECHDCPDRDLPNLGPVATVAATDQHGFVYRTDTCALHLDGAVRHFDRHGWPCVVEVPASSPRWYERTERETYWALDEYAGIAVTRTTLDVWAVWQVADTVPFGAPLCLHPDRGVAEMLGQACAAVWAADAYELASTVAPPVSEAA